MTSSLTILSNNGNVGGGEIMMLALARVARAAAVPVRIVAPSRPREVADQARTDGFDVVEIPCDDRLGYLEGLARHRRFLGGQLWWCNGLVPALATVGSPHRRVVQLHQPPVGIQRRAWQVARLGVDEVFVPSRSMTTLVPGATALTNWTEDVALLDPPEPDPEGTVRLGFIGRFSPIKGLDVLARAIQQLDHELDRPIELVLAGDGRFVPTTERTAVEIELARIRAVRRMGWVDRATFFRAVDVVVVPSVWSEPFGLVAAEAMAHGRAVIVSDAGALSDITGPDHPWVARAGDPMDTARVIRRVIDTGPGERDATLAAARRRWETEFGPAAGTARVVAALTRLGLRPRPVPVATHDHSEAG